MKAEPPYKLIATLNVNFIITPIVILIRPCVSMSPLNVRAKIAPITAAIILKSHGKPLIEIGSLKVFPLNFGNKKAPEGAIVGLIRPALLFPHQILTVLQCARVRERLQYVLAMPHRVAVTVMLLN